MKRLFKYLMVLTSVALLGVSCSKDDSDSNIVGKWQSVNYSYQEYEAGKLIDEGTASCIDWYLGFEFKNDGTGTYISYEDGDVYTIGLTWVIMGEKLMITVNDAPSGDNSMAFDLVSVSGDVMVLSEVEEYTSGGMKYKYVTTYNFKRL